MLNQLILSLLFFQAPIFEPIQGLTVISCPSGQLSIPVAMPPGTTKMTFIKLVCIPINAEMFSIEDGYLTLNFTMTLSPQYSLIDLIGPYDSKGTLWSFKTPLKSGTDVFVFKNGVHLSPKIDYKINGNNIVFIGNGLSTKNDVVKVYFRVY